MVRDDAVDLFGHRPVEGPKAGLDVSEGPPHLRRDERAREGRVRVSIHEHEIQCSAGELVPVSSCGDFSEPLQDVALPNRWKGETKWRGGNAVSFVSPLRNDITQPTFGHSGPSRNRLPVFSSWNPVSWIGGASWRIDRIRLNLSVSPASFGNSSLR